MHTASRKSPVEVRQGDEVEEEGEEEEQPPIKSINPHLAGGEKTRGFTLIFVILTLLSLTSHNFCRICPSVHQSEL